MIKGNTLQSPGPAEELRPDTIKDEIEYMWKEKERYHNNTMSARRQQISDFMEGITSAENPHPLDSVLIRDNVSSRELWEYELEEYQESLTDPTDNLFELRASETARGASETNIAWIEQQGEKEKGYQRRRNLKKARERAKGTVGLWYRADLGDMPFRSVLRNYRQILRIDKTGRDISKQEHGRPSMQKLILSEMEAYGSIKQIMEDIHARNIDLHTGDRDPMCYQPKSITAALAEWNHLKIIN